MNVISNHSPYRCIIFMLAIFCVTKASIAIDFIESETIEPDEWHYYPVEVPSSAEGWRIVLHSEQPGLSLHLQQGQEPTSSSLQGTLFSAEGGYTSTILRDSSLLSSDTWYVGVRNASEASVSYTLNAQERAATVELEWDEGDFSNAYVVEGNDTGGVYHFTIEPQTPALGVWRHALRVTEGEARILIRQGAVPTSGNNQFDSGVTDFGGGIVRPGGGLPSEWHLMVMANPGTEWSLVSGDVEVVDLGDLASSSSFESSLETVMPGEGVKFIRTEIPQQALGWHLWLKSVEDGADTIMNTMYVRETGSGLLPAPDNNGNWGWGAQSSSEYYFDGQGFIVPDNTFNPGDSAFYVAIIGEPGEAFFFDSRQPTIESISYDSLTETQGGDGSWYHTFSLSLPSDLDGWEVTALGVQGDAFVAARQGSLPNADNNLAFSEVEAANNSFTIISEALSAGSTFITVYGENESPEFQLHNREPRITTIDFEGDIVNDETNRTGWRYFRMDDIDSQAFNWMLELENAASSTQIAIQRNNLPGYRESRQNGSISTHESVYEISSLGFLQQPIHDPDIWYVGIYNGGQALDDFSLSSGPIVPMPLEPSDSDVDREIRQGEWLFYTFEIPENMEWQDIAIKGWNLDLKIPDGQTVGMVLQRGQMPDNAGTAFNNVGNATSWSTSSRVAANVTWSGRTVTYSGERRVGLSFGEGQPLQAGTYYLAVTNGQFNDPSSFTLTATVVGGEGSGADYEIKALGYDEGSVADNTSTETLAPQDVAYYVVEIPENTRSWRLSLELPEGHEAAMFMRKDYLPNLSISTGSNTSNAYQNIYQPLSSPSFNQFGRQVRLNTSGRESFDLWPRSGQEYVDPGTYYILVASQGQEPSGNNETGEEAIEYTLISHGEVPVVDLGVIEAGEVESLVGESYLSGEINYYRFEIPEGTLGLQLQLLDVVNNPYMRLRQDEIPGSLFQMAGSGSAMHKAYGHYNGRPYQWHHEDQLYLTNPDPGVYHLTVAAQNGAQLHPAEFTLNFEAIEATEIALDHPEEILVEGLAPGNWVFYEVDVPEDILGWEVRVTEWETEGNEWRPVIALRPELLPENTANSNSGWPTFTQPRDATAPSWTTARTIAKNQGEWTGLNRPFEGGNITETYLHSIPMGQPLDSGIYYIGFYLPAQATAPYDFKWTSRAIGAEDSGYSYEVAELNFQGQADGNLAARDVSYYKVEIEDETYRSWHFELLLPEHENRGDDAQLYVRKDYLPNTESISTAATSPALPISGAQQQLRLNRPGEESFVFWPANGEEYIPGGTYYLMVVSDGQNPDVDNMRIGEGSIDYQLISHGEYVFPEDHLIGELMPGEVVTRSGEYAAGQQSYYQFEIPEGIEAVEIRMNTESGSPIMRLTNSAFPGSIALTSYGHYSGYSPLISNSSLITLTNSAETPLAGEYTLMVVHAQNSGHEAAEFEITIADTGPQLVEELDGFSDEDITICAGEWVYYRFTVPEQINGHDLLGWELRITDWEGEEPPAMVIRRDELPNSVNPTGSIGRSGNITQWNSGSYLVASSSTNPDTWTDWTGRPHSAAGELYEGIALALPMGQPLQPGEYYVGFRSRLGSIGPITFSWDSAAIGLEGSGMTHEILEWEYDAEINHSLQPREVAHYYIDIPENTPNWNIALDLEEDHEAVVYIRGTHLPFHQARTNSHNNPADWSRAENTSITANIGPHVYLGNAGNKRFTLWPENGEEYIEAGRYYISVAAIGEGAEETDRIGVGETEYTLRNGPVAITEFEGVINLGDSVVIEDESFSASEFNYYQFEVGEDVRALEVRMANRVGHPRMHLRQGHIASRTFFAGTWRVYGHYSGYIPLAQSDDILVLPDLDPGLYTLVIGYGATPGYGDGGYDLRITSLEPQSIGFGSGVRFATGSLFQGQRDFYDVEVTDTVEFREPESSGEREVIGWRIRIEEASGNTQFRARKGDLPAGTSSSETQTDWFSGSMLLVPPFLEDENWFIEVNGVEASDYTISSEAIVLSSMEYYWEMPADGESPDDARFANTQTDINPEGMNLDAGDYHLYAFEVPEGNGGLLRTVLEKISGDELSLYLRPHALPTSSHGETSGFGSTREHLITGSSTTQYGNWVPRTLVLEDQLEPGIWFAKIQATGASASYHLRMDHNAADRVQDLDLDGGTFTNQTLVGTDWRYYRVQLPEVYEDTPDEWNITFTDPAENVVMYLRETIPPGLSQTTNIGTSTSYQNPRDWTHDGRWSQNRHGTNRRFTSPGTYTLSGDMLRPGQTYYLGFRANEATTFSVSSDIGSGTIESTYGSFAFLSGTGGLEELELEPGEVKTWQVDFPAEASRWRSIIENDSSVEFYLGQHGHLPLISSTGNYAVSNGSENWQYQSSLFPTNFRSGENVFYLTAVNTSDEIQAVRIFVDWRDPEDFEMDISIVGEGSVTTTPESYQTGDSVELLASAAPGWVFAGWEGDVSSSDNPLNLTLFEELSIIANFEVLEGVFVQSAEVLTDQALLSNSGSETVTIRYTVVNTGTSAETITPVISLDSGTESWSKSADPVEVAIGESETVYFEYDLSTVELSSPYSAAYHVGVDGVHAGSFNGLFLEAEAYWTGRGYDEIEIGDYEEIGYRVYPLADEDIEIEIEVMANDEVLETDLLEVSQGSYTPSWQWFVWYAEEPGVYEITVNGIVAENSPVTFFDDSDPGDPDPVDPPVIEMQPVSVITEHLGAATFRVTASGELPIHYQWYFEENLIIGANENTLQLQDVTLDAVGSYSVNIENDGGDIWSEVVRLDIISDYEIAVDAPLEVMVDETSEWHLHLQTVFSGSIGYPDVAYAVSVNGPGVVQIEIGNESFTLGNGSREWLSLEAFELGSDFDGTETGEVVFHEAGVYDFELAVYPLFETGEAHEEAIAVVDFSVEVSDWMSPVIINNPENQTVNHGESVMFVVEAEGDGELQYRWFKGLEEISALGSNPGYSIASATSASAGDYSVEVVSPYGIVLSSVATLVVVLPDELPEVLGDAEKESENTYQSSWLGRFFTGDASGRWINHETLGWFFVYPGTETGSVWLWDPVSNSNFYTNQTLYPYFYSDQYGWVYYHLNPSATSRWFQRVDDQELIDLELLPGPLQP